MIKLDIRKIIREEWENVVLSEEEWEDVLISEEEYQPNDKLDLNNVNLYTEFQKLNQSLFGGNVPEVPMKWSRRKTALGHVKFQRSLNTGQVKNIELWMSTFFDITYRQFLNTLAHEMIHVLLETSPNPPYLPHGREFHREADRINAMGLGFNITETNGEDLAMSDATKQRIAGKKFIGIILDLDGKDFLAVTSRQVYERDFESLVNIFDGLVNRRHKYNRVEINVVESQNTELMKYKQQRSFARGISYSPLSEELMVELLNGNIFKTVTIERDKEKLVAEEIQ